MADRTAAAQGVYTFLPVEKVFYGAGSLANLPAEADRLGCRRALIITGHTLAAQTGLVKSVEDLLGSRHAGTYAGIRQHAPESGIREAVEQARACQADLLVSVGGGSPIDAAKLVVKRLAGDGAAPAASSGVQAQPAAPAAYIPQIAIPTTLSAAEFSHVAGYTDEAKRSKTGVTDLWMTPRSIILDPEMTLETPMWLWLSSGIRSLDHAVETLYAPGYHPVNDVLALQAVRDLFVFLPQCKAEPSDLTARQMCQQAAWMSYFGPPSAGAHTGLSHTIGKRIGATYAVPHGVTSCILLPHVMRYKATNDRDAACLASMTRARDRAGGSSDRDAALAAADAVAGLVQPLDLPSRLRDVNVPVEAIEGIAGQVGGGDEELKRGVVEILRNAW